MARARAMSEKDAIAHQKKMGRPMVDIAKIQAKAKKRTKYGNVPEIVDGVRMASKREAKRYRELGLLMKSGEIHMLARQVRFRLPGGVEYVADFVYTRIWPRTNGAYFTDLVVEDAKGVRTREFINKKKQMASEYCIDVKEV